MKLIILNGCPLAGKSTIAEQLYKDFQLGLYANIDAWRSLVNEVEGERLKATLFSEMRLSVLVAVTDEVRVIKKYVQLWEEGGSSLRHFTFINGEVAEVDSAP